MFRYEGRGLVENDSPSRCCFAVAALDRLDVSLGDGQPGHTGAGLEVFVLQKGLESRRGLSDSASTLKGSLLKLVNEGAE